jgi:hypothetical protein
VQEAVAQQVARLDRGEVAEPDHVLLRNRVGEIRVHTNFLHVGHDQQRRIVESVGVLLQLGIGLDQVAAAAFVFPGEAVPLPHVGKAGRVADLPGRLLEGVFGAVRVDVARLIDPEQAAQVEKMLLRGGALCAWGALFNPSYLAVVPRADSGLSRRSEPTSAGAPEPTLAPDLAHGPMALSDRRRG